MLVLNCTLNKAVETNPVFMGLTQSSRAASITPLVASIARSCIVASLITKGTWHPPHARDESLRRASDALEATLVVSNDAATYLTLKKVARFIYLDASGSVSNVVLVLPQMEYASKVGPGKGATVMPVRTLLSDEQGDLSVQLVHVTAVCSEFRALLVDQVGSMPQRKVVA